MNIPKLNRFSHQFAEILFSQFPMLTEYSKHDTAHPGSLLVELSAPIERPDAKLWVCTDNEEVTVGFGLYHEHFDWPSDPPDDPMTFIRLILSDKLLIYSLYRGGKWAQSTTFKPDERLDRSSLKEGDRITILSWSGRLDKQFGVDDGAV